MTDIDPQADRMHLAKAIAWFALALILGVLAVAVGAAVPPQLEAEQQPPLQAVVVGVDAAQAVGAAHHGGRTALHYELRSPVGPHRVCGAPAARGRRAGP